MEAVNPKAKDDGDDMLTIQGRIAEAEKAKGDETANVIRTSFFDTGPKQNISLWRRLLGCHRKTTDQEVN